MSVGKRICILGLAEALPQVTDVCSYSGSSHIASRRCRGGGLPGAEKPGDPTMADMSSDPNREAMFPILSAAQIARVAPWARERVFSDRETLWMHGDRNRPLFV